MDGCMSCDTVQVERVYVYVYSACSLPHSVFIVIATSREVITKLFVHMQQPHFWVFAVFIEGLGRRLTGKRYVQTQLCITLPFSHSLICFPLLSPVLSFFFPFLLPSLPLIQQQDALERKQRREKRSKHNKFNHQWLEAEVEYRTAKVHGRSRTFCTYRGSVQLLTYPEGKKTKLFCVFSYPHFGTRLQ